MKKRALTALLLAASMTGTLAGCGPKVVVSDGGGSTSAAASETTASSDGTSTETSAAAEETTGDLSFAQGTVLRMATGYNSSKTGLFFDAETAGEGVTLADGNTYNAGDLKPTWVEVEKELGMVFEDKYQGNSATKEFEYWKEQLDQVDMVSGTALKLTEYGEAGSLVNIGEYLDQMPNFKAYL